jgi:multicomponent Na+:H+ antiporter subunit E
MHPLRFLGTGCALLGIWILLSGRFDGFHVAIGLLGAAAVSWLYHRAGERAAFPLGRFLAFVPWLLGQVLLSNLRIARLVLSRRSRIRPRLVERRVSLEDDRALTLLGCAITLTPGTLAIEAEPHRVLVHALDAESARDIEEDRMAVEVRRVFEGGGP